MARKNTLEQKRTRRLQKQLTAYSVAAGAALALASPADASIIHSGPQNIPVDVANPNQYLDIDGMTFNQNSSAVPGADVTFNHSISSYYAANVIQGPAIFLQWSWPVLGNNWAKRFAPSDQIQLSTPGYWANNAVLHSATNYYGVPLFGAGLFDGYKGYIGIKFDIGGNDHLGWIEYEGQSNWTAGTILGWAYEDTPGTPINAGQVPIPGTFGLGLLALGAAGVARLRQRKKEAKEETA